MYELMGGHGLPFGLTHHKACLLLEGCSGWVVGSDMDGFPCFSDNLFAILIYYFKVGDIDTGVV